VVASKPCSRNSRKPASAIRLRVCWRFRTRQPAAGSSEDGCWSGTQDGYRVSWHYAFFINLPIGAGLLALLLGACRAASSFAGVFVMSLMVGAALYGILYIIPQFLTSAPGCNSEQSGCIAAISGVPTILMLALFPVLARRIDLRAAIAFGLLLYGVSCFMNADLISQTSGPELVAAQIVRGFAQFFSMLFLNQAATNSVARDCADDASGLFNAARNLGGSFGLAAIATLQERRGARPTARDGGDRLADRRSGRGAAAAADGAEPGAGRGDAHGRLPVAAEGARPRVGRVGRRRGWSRGLGGARRTLTAAGPPAHRERGEAGRPSCGLPARLSIDGDARRA
jgi:hypothetical protein